MLLIIVHHLILAIARITFYYWVKELTEVLVHQKKKLDISFSKATTKFCFSLHYNVDNSHFFVNGKKSLNLKLTRKMLPFQLSCLGSIFNRFSALESGEVSLNGNVHDFSLDYNSLDKSDILNHSQIFNDKE